MSGTWIGALLIGVFVLGPVAVFIACMLWVSGRWKTNRDRARWVVCSWGFDGLPNYTSGHRYKWAAHLADNGSYQVISIEQFDAAWARSPYATGASSPSR
jgi:hypothetical protein